MTIRETLNDIFKRADSVVSSFSYDSDVKSWLQKVDDAVKREKRWREKARRVVEIYEQERAAAESGEGAIEGSSDFNILFANTETLSPAVYNNTPRPVVKRKIDKENPIAVAAAKVLKGVLDYQVDTADSRYTPFDELQKQAVLEALVPGRGLCRFSYDAEVDAAGTDQAAIKEETICGDSVPWDRMVHGYAKQWADVPFIAYEHFMTKEELEANFGKDKAAGIKLTHQPATDGDKDGEESMPADAQGAHFAHIWEIWDKRTRKQLFISEGHKSVIETNPDPLGLEGFFNCPRPINFTTRIKSLVPNTLYLMYEQQARELDIVTRRISGLTKMMKILGFYDGQLEGLDQLLAKPEGTLLPAPNAVSLAQGQTLEKSIWLMPIDKMANLLQQLYLNRAQVIATIQKISGVADIMLGASAASETLGAQKIKESWGTMRLKRMQKEVQRFSRDCFRMQAEIAAKKFRPETLAKMTGLQYPLDAQRQQLVMQRQQLMAQADQLQMQAQMGGQRLPPQAGQQLQQQLQQLDQQIAVPTWEEIAAFMKNDTIRNYTIDVETNSTVDIEATEDKQELAEFMNSFSQLLNGMLPMVKEGVLPFEPAKAVTLSIVRKFRLDDDVEEAVRSMQQPQQKEDPAVMKVKADMERDKQKAALDQQKEQQKAQLEAQAQQREQQLAEQEFQLKQRELQQKERELAMQMEFKQAEHAMKMQALRAQTIAKTIPAAAPAQPAGGGQGDSGNADS